MPLLSELQERLLKKELVVRQISNEVSYLENNPRLLQALCYLPPIKTSPFLHVQQTQAQTQSQKTQSNKTTDNETLAEYKTRLPVFSFLFSSVLLTFPFIQRAGPNFLTLLDKFWDEFLNSRGGYSSTVERGGEGGTVLPSSDRKAVKRLAKKLLTFLINLGIKTPSQLKRLEEENKVGIKVEEEDKNDGSEIDRDVEEDDATALRECHVDVGGILYVNIPTVRVRRYKKHMRTHEHVDFIITTHTNNSEETYCVKRSYRDFSVLRKQLAATNPALELPKVPSRFHKRDQEASNLDPSNTDSHRSHELARLHLRSFIHSLFSALLPSESLNRASSLSDWPPPISAFLSDIEAQTIMNAAETTDSHRRAQAERHVWRERRRVEREVAARAKFLSRSMKEFTQIILRKGGLTDVFGTIAEFENIEELPPNFQSIIEWATINFAFTLLELFSSPTGGPDTLATIKRVHSVVPYRALAAIMRWTNPLAIAKGVINLLLKRPPWPGGKSVFQQIITAGIGDEVEELDMRCREGIEELKRLVETKNVNPGNYASRTGVDVVEDAATRIRNYVSDTERMSIIGKCPDSSTLLAQILAHPRYGTPVIGLPQTMTSVSANTSLASLSTKETFLPDSAIPELIVILALESAKRDKLALKELAEHAATADLMKEIVGMFYGPLMDLYRNAHADRMVLLCGSFVKDLIAVSTRVVDRAVTQASGTFSESGSDLNAKDRDPFSTSSSSDFRSYFDLLNRHTAGFYRIAHALHAEPGSVLGECVRWSDAFVGWIRGGRLDLSMTSEYAKVKVPEKEDEWIRNIDLEELLRAVVKRRESPRDASDERTEESSGISDVSFQELAELVRKDAEELERRRECKQGKRRRKMEQKVRLATGGSTVDLADDLASSSNESVSLDAKIERENVVEPVGWGQWLFGFGKSADDSTKLQQTTAPMGGAFSTEGEDLEDFEEDSDDEIYSDDEKTEEEEEEEEEEELVVRNGTESTSSTSAKISHPFPVLPVVSKLNANRDSKNGPTFPSFFSSSSSLFSEGSSMDELASEEDVSGSSLLVGGAWMNAKTTSVEDVELRKVPGDTREEKPEDARIETVGELPMIEEKTDGGKKKKRVHRKLEAVPLLEEEFRKVLQAGFLT